MLALPLLLSTANEWFSSTMCHSVLFFVVVVVRPNNDLVRFP